MTLALLILALFAFCSAASADPAERVTVAVVKGTLFLEAHGSSLDRVLGKIGEALHARVIIETVLAEDLVNTRVDAAFAQALDELSNVRDRSLLAETFSRVLMRESDSTVLQQLFELASQETSPISREALQSFVTGRRDATARVQAVTLLAEQAGEEPATRSLLRALATDDNSPEVRAAAGTALRGLEMPRGRPASELPGAKLRVNHSPTSPTLEGGIR
jgi:hypothetical protein